MPVTATSCSTKIILWIGRRECPRSTNPKNIDHETDSTLVPGDHVRGVRPGRGDKAGGRLG
jgi:hypothetical protein